MCNISVSVLQQKFINNAYVLTDFKIHLIYSVLGKFPPEKIPPRKFPPGSFHPGKLPSRKLSPGILSPMPLTQRKYKSICFSINPSLRP